MAAIAPHPAQFWHRDGTRVVCDLCPRYCRIPEGGHGFCYIRQVAQGQLVTLGWGHPTGFALDPVEKKPLNHFLPGATALSFGTAGCNLGCKFCQNWSISKAALTEENSLTVTPEEVVRLAQARGAPTIAYTYNDPVIFAEFVRDCGKLAREAGLKNILVTAGYVTREARAAVFEYADAANVDLKGFSDDFYRTVCGGVHLGPVLDTLRWLVRETKVWTEITTLLIPGKNDDPNLLRRQMAWIRDELGAEVPLHLTAFHPDWKMLDVAATPHHTLTMAREIALAAGLKYVYVGNVHDDRGQNTYCPRCQALLIERDWYVIGAYRIRNGHCPDCGQAIAGVFGARPGGARPTHIPIWRPGEARPH